MNDRSLRNITIGLGGTTNGIPREDGFNITPASEVMAILCMAENFEDLKRRLGNIYIGSTFDKKMEIAKDPKNHGNVRAFTQSVVDTLEESPKEFKH